MNKFTKLIKLGSVLALSSFILLNCSGTTNGTDYAKSKTKDSGQFLTYNEWVGAVGQQKTDAMFSAGLESDLNLLTYAAGISNVILLVNIITDINKLITMVGNDFALPTATGLGALRIVDLLNSIDAENQTVVSWTGAAPAGQDTITELATFVNCIPLVDINPKIVGLIDSFTNRSLTSTNDKAEIDKMSRIISHISSVTKMCDLLANMSALSVTTKVNQIIQGVNNGDYLAQVIEEVTDTTKMGWLIDNIASGTTPSATALVTMMNDLGGSSTTDMAKLGQLLNQMEDNTTWTGQVGGPSSWNSTIPAPSSNSLVTGSGMRQMVDIIDGLAFSPNPLKLSYILKGVNSMTMMMRLIEDVGNSTRMVDLISQFPAPAVDAKPLQKMAWLLNNLTLADEPAMAIIVTNIANAAKLADLITEMEDGTSWATMRVPGGSTWDSVTPAPINNVANGSGMARMKTLIQGLNTNPHPKKLAYLINQVTDMTKMMRLVQDVAQIGDMITLLQSIDDVDINPVPAQNMGLILENMALTSVPRMVDLIDGRRNAYTDSVTSLAYASTTEQPPYIGYLVDLIRTLDQAKEGPLKVVTLVDNITNMGKMIDIVYNVGSTSSASCTGQVGQGSTTVVSNGARLSYVINDIDKASLLAPQDQAVNTLVYLIENVAAMSKMVSMICNVAPANMSFLVNKTSCISQALDGSANSTACTGPVGTRNAIGPTAIAAGQKLAAVVDNTTDAMNLNFVVNNVSNIQKMADLINQLSIASSPKLATLLNEVDSDANGSTNCTWATTPGTYGTCANTAFFNEDSCVTGGSVWTVGTGRGQISTNRCSNAANNDSQANCIGGAGTWTPGDMCKMVNMVDYISDLSQVAILIDTITDASKLSFMVRRVSNSSNLIGLVNGVIADASATIVDMVGLVNQTTSPDLPKLIDIVNNLNHANEASATTTDAHIDHQLIASLLAPVGGVGMVAQGVDYRRMVRLIAQMSTTDTSPVDGQFDSAVRIATVMKGLNANLIYNAGAANITRREGLVRLIVETPGQGVVLLSTSGSNPTAGNVNFPGVGPAHLAVMMNNAANASNLVTLMNAVNITDVVIMVGCGDHANEIAGDGNVLPDTAAGAPLYGPDFYTPCNTIGQGWVD